jgi:hypothetical protein
MARGVASSALTWSAPTSIAALRKAMLVKSVINQMCSLAKTIGS